MKPIKVIRKTTESEMTVILDFSPLKSNYREYINTGITFLNHMIEHIAWRGGFNIEVNVKLDKFVLTHVIAEDLGIALGKAVREYILSTDGVQGYGDAVGIIDEAKAQCAVSFEERAYCDIDFNSIGVGECVEGMNSENLETFLEGFAQGAMCTLHVDLIKGHNGHHIWEAIYRAFGIALNRTLMVSEERKGRTAGVAGKIEWVIE
ncbi:hypothetical protein FMM68_02995 [Lachnospiraceae bacterium MD329]|nr:hypothetical protein [Lachnospiraceae bacterium MD329]